MGNGDRTEHDRLIVEVGAVGVGFDSVRFAIVDRVDSLFNSKRPVLLQLVVVTNSSRKRRLNRGDIVRYNAAWRGRLR